MKGFHQRTMKGLPVSESTWQEARESALRCIHAEDRLQRIAIVTVVLGLLAMWGHLYFRAFAPLFQAPMWALVFVWPTYDSIQHLRRSIKRQQKWRDDYPDLNL